MMSSLFDSEPSPKNKGMGGHQSPASDTDVWLTPPHVLEALGPFDLDPCACMEPRPWPTAAAHYTEADNGLTKRWGNSSLRVFLNPPCGGPTVYTPWLQRMAEHGHGVALIFARTETEAFHSHIWPVADAILFLRGRLFFHRPDGTRANHNAGAPSCLIAYGAADALLLERCGLPGKLVRLR
jgi:hypothetical protein